jgi:hypothetical protein
MVNGELGLASHWLTLLRQPPQHQLSFPRRAAYLRRRRNPPLRVIAACSGPGCVRHPVCDPDFAAIREVDTVELDDAARVDGASAVQVYLRIYLPLMTPALAVVAIYALMLAWNDYLYPAVLLAVRNMTVAVTQGQLFADVDAEWNAMMAAAIIYVLPPIALLFALRRYVAASLTMAEITE